MTKSAIAVMVMLTIPMVSCSLPIICSGFASIKWLTGYMRLKTPRKYVDERKRVNS